AIAGGSSSTTVVPVRRRRSCAWPTRTPRIAVSVRFDAMAPLPESRRPSEFYLTDVRRRGRWPRFVPLTRGTLRGTDLMPQGLRRGTSRRAPRARAEAVPAEVPPVLGHPTERHA